MTNNCIHWTQNLTKTTTLHQSPLIRCPSREKKCSEICVNNPQQFCFCDAILFVHIGDGIISLFFLIDVDLFSWGFLSLFCPPENRNKSKGALLKLQSHFYSRPKEQYCYNGPLYHKSHLWFQSPFFIHFFLLSRPVLQFCDLRKHERVIFFAFFKFADAFKVQCNETVN